MIDLIGGETSDRGPVIGASAPSPSRRAPAQTDSARADAGVLPDPTAPLTRTWSGTVHGRFSENARRFPNRPAVVAEAGVLTYSELDRVSNRLARRLIADGVRPGDRIALYARRSGDLVAALLGVLKAGAAFVILDPAYPAARLAACLTAVSPRGWLRLPGTPPVLAAVETCLDGLPLVTRLDLAPVGGGDPLAGYPPDDPGVEVGPDDPAYAAFTSGSTGVPKAVLGTHRPLSHFLDWHVRTFGLTAADRFSLLSGLSHDPLLRDVFTPLWLGAELHVPGGPPPLVGGVGGGDRAMNTVDGGGLSSAVLQIEPAPAAPNPSPGPSHKGRGGNADRSGAASVSSGGPALADKPPVAPTQVAPDPQRLAEWLARSRVTVAHLTPPLGRLLAEAADRGALEALRYAFFAGDSLALRDITAFRRAAPSVRCVNFYGTTETPQAMGWHVVGDAAGRPDGDRIPVGRGIDGVQLLVLHPAGGLAEVGEVGEICVRTPYLTLGYLGDDALTAAKFPVNPFTGAADDRIHRTGDSGRYRPDGQVEFVGRRDGLVKVRGFRVELGEIEAALCAHPGVADAAATLQSAEPANERLAAYYVPRGTGTDLRAVLRDWLRARLPAHMVPASIVPLAALPLTPNGKRDRRALSTLEDSGDAPTPVAGGSASAPPDDVERRLARIWAECIPTSAPGPHDDFFDLGGHSLTAARVFVRIEAEFGRRLSPAVLYVAPTISALAAMLRAGRQRPVGSLVAVNAAGNRPPFFCFPGLPGHGLELRRLAEALGPDQPFYAVTVECPGRGSPAEVTIEGLASELLAEMRAVQPTGPYLLGGYSFGGLPAYEAARRLHAAGESVALLALIDTWGPGYPVKRSESAGRRLAGHVRHMVTAGVRGAACRLGRRIGDRFKRIGRSAGTLLWRCGLRWGRLQEAEAWARLRRAMRAYVPAPYAGPVTLFRAARQPDWLGHSFDDPHHGWDKVAGGGVRVHTVPGDHHEMVLQPAVRELGRRLDEALREAVGR